MLIEEITLQPELSSPARCRILGGSPERDGGEGRTEEILLFNIGFWVVRFSRETYSQYDGGFKFCIICLVEKYSTGDASLGCNKVTFNCNPLHCTDMYCTDMRCTSYIATLYCTALHYTSLHYTALHCTALYCIPLQCTALHCTVLHCTALYCTALNCTAVHYSTMQWRVQAAVPAL